MAAIERHARAEPERVAVTLAGTSVTYGELCRRSEALAYGLRNVLNVARGDRVALLSRNRTEYLEVELAVSSVGAVLVAMSWRYQTDEAVAVLQRSGATVAIVDSEWADRLSGPSVRQRLPRLRRVIGFDDAADMSYATLIANFESGPRVGVEDGEAHEIIYTSGTTGLPKGAVWTHAGVVWNALQQIADFGITRESSTYVCFDMNYIGGRHQFVWGVLLQGGTVHLKRSSGFDPAEVLRELHGLRVTHLLMVPTMLSALLDVLPEGETALPELEVLMCGGAPVTEALIDRVGALLPHVWLSHVYGLTEGGGTVTCLPKWAPESKRLTAGRPSLNARVRVVGADGEPLPPGGAGEIEVQAPTLCSGYYGDPDATAALFRDGWLRTGDVGVLDLEGYLTITGRTKELIISGGMNVFPAEVEAVLERHPHVRHAAVFGVPDERWGEAVAAAVVPHEGAYVSREELLVLCRDHLASHKKPLHFWFVTDLPRTASGKLRRAELAEAYSSGTQ